MNKPKTTNKNKTKSRAKNKALKLRAAMELTQEDFAHMLQVSFTTVSRWENGHTEPTGIGGTLLELLDQARDHAEDALITQELRDATTQADVVRILALLGRGISV